jgi:hypothetical protein
LILLYKYELLLQRKAVASLPASSGVQTARATMKSMIVLAVLLVATSLAEENLQPAEAPQDDTVQAQPEYVFGKPIFGRPWWPRPWSAGKRDGRQMAEGVQEEPNQVLPEASNYADSAEPFCWFRCTVIIGRKKRSIMPSIPAAAEALVPYEILGSATEMKLYNSIQDVHELYNTPVSRAELYERPLDPETPAPVAQALGYKQSSVVVTLKDGRRFMLVKGNRKGDGLKTILILGDHITDDWVKVGAKEIARSVLLDFAKAGGLFFDALRDNGKDAAMRMMNLQ